MNKTWGRTAAILSIALVLTACSDNDEPSTTPTPTASNSSASPSSSGSTSPSASASATSSPNASVPAGARARTEGGAIAFLTFFTDEVNRGLLNPKDPPDLFAFSDKECIACKKLQDLISEYATGDWSLKEPSVQIRDVGLATAPTSERVIINFTSVEREQILYKDGKPSASKTEANTAKKGAALKWVNGAWQMYGMENL